MERVTKEVDVDIVVPFNAIEIGKKISDNIKSKFIRGLRVTDKNIINIVESVLIVF